MSTGRKSRQNKNSFKNKIRLIVTPILHLVLGFLTAPRLI